ncbi:MAG: hypothetical protein WAK57_17355 [Desulfobacterales bacterium]|jgi:hypothetical protein
MSFKQKLKEEIKAIGIAALYFGSWIAALLLLKSLVLAEYRISFSGWSAAVVVALILSKVLLVLSTSRWEGGCAPALRGWMSSCAPPSTRWA